MASCPSKPTCAMFPLFRLGSNLALWQERYCDGTFERCERYKRSQAGEPVSESLLPNGQELRKVGS